MGNAWKVSWRGQNGKRYYRFFEGDKPKESGAIEFGKKLQEQGLREVCIISKRKAFGPPLRVIIPAGSLWCPYCLKIREFKELGVRRPDGTRIPKLWRCPTCLISIHDAYIRRYNFLMVLKLDPRAHEKRVKLPTVNSIKQIAATGGKQRRRSRVRA